MKKNKKTKQSRYILFPLHSLSLGLSYHFLLNCILDYFVIKELNKKHRMKIIEYYSRYSSSDFEDDNEVLKLVSDYTSLQNKIGRKGKTNIKMTFLRYKIIRLNDEKYEARYNRKDSKVKMYLDLLNDIFFKNVLDENQFRILCAVYSCLGNSPMRFITYEAFRNRMNGFMDKSKLEKESSEKGIKYKLLSNKLLSKNILILKQGALGRNFFDRQYDGRKYYYSIKYRDKKLMNMVKAKLMENKIRKDEEIIRYKTFRNELRDSIKKRFSQNEIIKISNEIKRIRAKPHGASKYLDVIKRAKRKIRMDK